MGEPSEHWQPEVSAEVRRGSGALNDLPVRFDQRLKASAVQPHRDAAGQACSWQTGESSSLEPSVLQRFSNCSQGGRCAAEHQDL